MLNTLFLPIFPPLICIHRDSFAFLRLIHIQFGLRVVLPLSSHSHFKRRKFMRFFCLFFLLYHSLVAMRRRHLRDSFTTQSASQQPWNSSYSLIYDDDDDDYNMALLYSSWDHLQEKTCVDEHMCIKVM